MTDQETLPTPPFDEAVTKAMQALEDRVMELENVVHALAPHNPNAGHSVVVQWLEKVGARVKAAVEKVV